MFTRISMHNETLKVVVRRDTELRLHSTCFRGRTARLAGNFNRWDDANDLFNDDEICSEFSRKVAEMREEWNRFSVTIECRTSVGWESSDNLDKYNSAMLESFRPNRKSYALRIKPSRTDIRAPQTRFVTFVVQYKDERDGPTAIVHSMYPGEDIGDLRGDVTHRERRVFFDWDHPGA